MRISHHQNSQFFFSLVYIFLLLIIWHLCTTMLITLKLFYILSNTKGNGALLDKNHLTSKPSKQTCLCCQIYSKLRYLHEIFHISKHSVQYFCEVLIPVKKSAIWLGNMLYKWSEFKQYQFYLILCSFSVEGTLLLDKM